MQNIKEDVTIHVSKLQELIQAQEEKYADQDMPEDMKQHVEDLKVQEAQVGGQKK